MSPSVATQTAAPGVIRVACVDCGMTTGCGPRNVRPCCRCRGGDLVVLGPWEPQPGLLTVHDLFDRGRLTFESPRFGLPIRVNTPVPRA